MHDSKAIPVTLIPGDGIGPEVTEALITTFDALGSPCEWHIMPMGTNAYDRFGNALPEQTLQSIKHTRWAIKGPIQTPLITGFRSPLVQLRNELELFANVRPCQILLSEADLQRPIDIVVVRENLEGLYAAEEYYIHDGDDPHGIAVATAKNTRHGCERIIRFAFEYALKHRRKKVTVVHKANVLKAFSGIFLESARSIYAREYKGALEMEELIIDACAMHLVMAPEKFDVIVTTNLFGDILSDLVSGLTGGVSMAPGANIGLDYALFEPVHGSAPMIAGRGTANPIGMLLSGAMLLEYIDLPESATLLRKAIADTLNVDLVRPVDLGGNASTNAMATAIARRLGT